MAWFYGFRGIDDPNAGNINNGQSGLLIAHRNIGKEYNNEGFNCIRYAARSY